MCPCGWAVLTLVSPVAMLLQATGSQLAQACIPKHQRPHLLRLAPAKVEKDRGQKPAGGSIVVESRLAAPPQAVYTLESYRLPSLRAQPRRRWLAWYVTFTSQLHGSY